jgi:hypothetical protein
MLSLALGLVAAPAESPKASNGRRSSTSVPKFASPGVRALYADELSSGPSSGHTPDGHDAPNEDLGMSTTARSAGCRRRQSTSADQAIVVLHVTDARLRATVPRASYRGL